MIRSRRSNFCFALLSLLSVLLICATAAQAQTPQQTLNQYVADLQKNPNDYALREKIIKHVQTMKQKPAIPEEARRHYVMAKTLSDEAKKVEDFHDAITEFRAALIVAPWWAEANRDFGLTLEAAQRYDEAIAYIKLYMATDPGSDRTRAAQDEIYKIEAKKKLAGKASRESSPAVVSAPKQNTFEHLLRKIDGRRYATRERGRQVLLDVRGRTFVQGFIEDNGSYRELGRTEIRGREFTEPMYSTMPAGIARIVERYWSISESGESITLRWRWSGGEIEQLIYLWQR